MFGDESLTLHRNKASVRRLVREEWDQLQNQETKLACRSRCLRASYGSFQVPSSATLSPDFFVGRAQFERRFTDVCVALGRMHLGVSKSRLKADQDQDYLKMRSESPDDVLLETSAHGLLI